MAITFITMIEWPKDTGLFFYLNDPWNAPSLKLDLFLAVTFSTNQEVKAHWPGGENNRKQTQQETKAIYKHYKYGQIPTCI